MAEDSQTGPVPPQGRPAIGARLAMGFLAAVRIILFLPAVACVVAVLVMMLVVCFVEEPVCESVIRILVTLAAAEMTFAAAVGAKLLEELIQGAHNHPGNFGPDPLEAAGRLVVTMIEVAVVLSGFALLLWIPAEIGRMQDMGVLWPLCWSLLGAAALLARNAVMKWLERRAVIPDTNPYSTPGTPPSVEP